MKKFILPLVLMSPLFLYLIWAHILPIFMIAYMFGGGVAIGILTAETVAVLSVLAGTVIFIRRIGK